MNEIIENIKTAVHSYFSRRKEIREDVLRSHRLNLAEHDIQVKEYKSALWLAYKGTPLVLVSAIQGDEAALYEVLKLARENYIDCELKSLIKR